MSLTKKIQKSVHNPKYFRFVQPIFFFSTQKSIDLLLST